MPNLFQSGTADDSNDIGHVGDWPIEKNEPATVGLIYYEYVQDENNLNNKPVYYYKGYWEDLSDSGQYNVRSLTNLNLKEGQNFPSTGYVVEDGYALVVKVKNNRKNQIKAPNGTELSDTKTFIGTDNANGKEYDSLSLSQSTVNDDGNKIGLDKDDYKLYRIKEPDEGNQSLYKMVDQTKQLNVYVVNSDETTKTKYASFNVNLYSANAVFAPNDKLPDSLTIRSARQFYNLFYESVNNKNFGLLTSNHTIYQEMDIDFQQEFTNKFGIPTDDYKKDSNIYQSKFKKLNTADLIFRCTYNGNKHYLKNWTRTDKQNLFGKECAGGTLGGTLENLNFDHVTGQYLFDKNSGNINSLTFTNCNMKGYFKEGKAGTNLNGLTSKAKPAPAFPGSPFDQDTEDSSAQNTDSGSDPSSTSSSNQTTGQTLNQADSHSNQAAGNVSNKDSNN